MMRWWSKKDKSAMLVSISNTTHIADWTGWTPLHYFVWFQDYVEARSLVQQSAGAHSAAYQEDFSPVEESPTSISLYSSAAFFAWRQVLEDVQLPFEEFVIQEFQRNPLGSMNWDKGSLMQVFTLKPNHAVYPWRPCERCIVNDEDFSLVEIAWQNILQRFNPKKETLDLLDDLRLEDRSSSSSSVEDDEKCTSQGSANSTATETASHSGINLSDMKNKLSDTLGDVTPRNYRYEWVCVDCWHYMLGTPGAINYCDPGSDSDIDDESDTAGDDNDYNSDSDDSPVLLSI